MSMHFQLQPSPERARESGDPSAWFLILPVVILLALCASMYGWYRYDRYTHRSAASLVQAISNAKQVYMVLEDFRERYGQYPTASTAVKIENSYNTIPLSGQSSNALFRQLFAAELIHSEEIFFVNCKFCKKPDNVIDDSHTLSSKECGFSYVTGVPITAKSDTPILVAPMIPGTTVFERNLHKNQAVILRANGSVTTHKISRDGHVYIDDMDLFDPRQPFWNGSTPTIHYPE